MDLRSILAVPAAYRMWTNVVTGDTWRKHVAEYIRPKQGDRVLDMGCGPADILTYLPEVDYVGIDISEEYIAAARERFGSRGRFECKAVRDVAIDEPSSYDLVLSTGVVHHLDDDEAARLFESARDALKPGGRLVTYDGCFVEGQSAVARRLLKMDRGQYVRIREAYTALASKAFSDVKVHLRHDMLRIPYTHIIMECTR